MRAGSVLHPVILWSVVLLFLSGCAGVKPAPEVGTLPGSKQVLLGRYKPTFYCLADFSYYDKDSTKLSNFLLDKVQVVTVPGVEFGMEGHLRLSYCGTVKDITEGIERMKWALDPNSPNELYIGERKLVRDWT